MNTAHDKEEKQQLLRERILNQKYDVTAFLDYIRQQKGVNLDNYTKDELEIIVESFVDMKRNEKQQFLRENIINQNYDVQQFLAFMENSKIDGINIDNWTFEELKEVAIEFQQIYGQQQQVQETQEEADLRMSKMENYMTKSIMKNQTGQVGSYFNVDDEQDKIASVRKTMGNVFKKKPSFQNIDNPYQELDQQKQITSPEKQTETEQKSEQKPEVSSIQEQHQEQQQQNSKIKRLDSQSSYKEGKISSATPKGLSKKLSLEIPKYEITGHSGFKLMQEHFFKQIQCVKEKSRIPQKGKLKLQITNWERKSGGLFGWTDKYVLYEVETEPFHWTVKRRMNDFIQFRKILVKLFPGKNIPPLDINSSESSDQDIQKRMQFLTVFCNHLKNSEEIWSNICTITFFSKQEKWDDLAQKAKEQADPTRSISSMDGNLDMRLAKENYIYKSEVEQFISQAEQQFNDLAYQAQKLTEDLYKISDQLTKINQTQQVLVMQVTNFNSQLSQKLKNSDEVSTILENNDYLQKTYKDLSDIIGSWSKSTRQHGQLSDHLQTMFRYQKLQFQNAKDLFKKYDEIEYSYLNFKYNMEKQSKYNPSLLNNPKIIGEEVALEENYGYWSQQIYIEMQDLLNSQADDYVYFFNYLTRFETLRINELVKSWGKIIDGYFSNPFPIPKPFDVDLRHSIVVKR